MQRPSSVYCGTGWSNPSCDKQPLQMTMISQLYVLLAPYKIIFWHHRVWYFIRDKDDVQSDRRGWESRVNEGVRLGDCAGLADRCDNYHVMYYNLMLNMWFDMHCMLFDETHCGYLSSVVCHIQTAHKIVIVGWNTITRSSNKSSTEATLQFFQFLSIKSWFTS